MGNTSNRMHRSVICLFVIIVSIGCTVDCSSVCPRGPSKVKCRHNPFTRYFSTCHSDKECKSGSKCCPNYWCVMRCVRVKTVKPRGARCWSQRDCSRYQCCVNRNTRARSGVCQGRRGTAASCHNPSATGFHFVSCPGPTGVVHPDLCPCTCGQFCAMGPNPRKDAHGGYIGTCSFG